MDTREKKVFDIFGQEIKPGSVILFSSAGAALDVAVVSEVRLQGKHNRLIGFTVVYPYMEYGGISSNVTMKKKLIRAGRELVVVPASKLSSLASGQALRTPAFAQIMQYLSEKSDEDAS